MLRHLFLIFHGTTLFRIPHFRAEHFEARLLNYRAMLNYVRN